MMGMTQQEGRLRVLTLVAAVSFLLTMGTVGHCLMCETFQSYRHYWSDSEVSRNWYGTPTVNEAFSTACGLTRVAASCTSGIVHRWSMSGSLKYNELGLSANYEEEMTLSCTAQAATVSSPCTMVGNKCGFKQVIREYVFKCNDTVHYPDVIINGFRHEMVPACPTYTPPYFGDENCPCPN